MKKVKIDNPFVVSGYVSPDYFCDRIGESETLSQNLTNGNNVTLFSPRRMGKTGLIHHVFNKLKERDPDILTVYVDLMPTESLSDFAGVFSSALINELDSSPKSLFKKALSVLSRLRPTISFDPVSGESKFSVDIAKGEEQATVEQLLSFVGSCGKQFYIAFDEFQQIAEFPEHRVEALLRSMIQNCRQTTFLFSGSKQHTINQMFLSKTRPFYQNAQLMDLGPLKLDVYSEFVCRLFGQYGKQIDPDVVSQVYTDYNATTWYMQMLMNELFALTAQGETCTTPLLGRAQKNIIQVQEGTYMMQLNMLSSKQKSLLQAIAHEKGVKAITAKAFIKKYSLDSASSVQSALRALLEKEIVTTDNGLYRVSDFFFGQWLVESY